MTFKFTYKEKEYDIRLTNGLIIDIEEAYEKPIDTMWHVIRGKSSIMAKGKLAIYVGILNHLAVREQDISLATSVDALKLKDDFNYNSDEVTVNCVLFFEALIKQQQEFRKIAKEDSKPKKK